MLSFMAKTPRISVLVLHTISPDSFHFLFSKQTHFSEASPAVICKAFEICKSFFHEQIMHKNKIVKERIPTYVNLFFHEQIMHNSNCQGKNPNKSHQWS